MPFRTQQFLLVASQAGSFHKAAKTFGVHPSVLARHIDRLESGIGVKLFDRDRNTFSVTEPGRLFVGEIQEAMTHAARA
jgi:DNA-binding transcriptional LysR family regulator